MTPKQREVLKAADPVYRFLGVEGLESKRLPAVGKLLDSRLGYFIRPGKHSMTEADWELAKRERVLADHAKK